MQPAEPSRTAKMAAIGRGMHRLLHRPPWVFDDPYALPLAGPDWEAIYGALEPLLPEQVRDAVGAFLCVRSRYTEDRLAAGEFGQYVILGAGLDSFAWRRPDALGSLTVFEIDHPATQAWKQERAAVIALPRSERHVFAPVDFETQSLREGLDAAGLDWSVPTLFSWIGVLPYLTADAIAATLETVAGAAPGSEIVLHYAVPDEERDELSRPYVHVITALAEQSGEPLLTFWPCAEAERFVAACGLEVVDHPEPAELVERYFAGREDGLVPHAARAHAHRRSPAALSASSSVRLFRVGRSAG